MTKFVHFFTVDDELTFELTLTEEVSKKLDEMSEFDRTNYILKQLRNKTDNLFFKYRNFEKFGQIDEGVVQL